MADTTSGKQLHLRIPADLHEVISQFAADTERTVNGATVYLIRRGLDNDRPATSHGTLELR